MVQNREQLHQEANDWLNAAGNDISSRFNAFFRSHPEVGVEELANVLDISVNALNPIMDGDLTNVTAETLVKLFIANDLAIEIRPVSETPIGGYGPNGQGVPPQGCGCPMPPRGQGMPPRGGYGVPMPPRPYYAGGPQGGNYGAPIPPRGGFGRRIPVGGTQNGTVADPYHGHEPFAMHDPQGDQHADNGVGRTSATGNGGRATTHYDSMDIPTLRNLIIKNLWDSEINVNTASRDELIDFLVKKENQMLHNEAHPSEGGARPVATHHSEADQPRNVGTSDSTAAGLLKAMLNAAKNDPALAEQLRKFAQ